MNRVVQKKKSNKMFIASICICNVNIAKILHFFKNAEKCIHFNYPNHYFFFFVIISYKQYLRGGGARYNIQQPKGNADGIHKKNSRKHRL